MKPLGKMDHRQILKAIPHRYPFLFVDAITECDYVNSATGYKNVTLNEPCFLTAAAGEKAKFPESLITECMAQVGAVVVLSLPENTGKIMLFAAADGLRFYHPVYPGDQLVSKVKRVFAKHGLGKMKAYAYVSDKLVAEGEFTYALAGKTANPV